MDGPRAAAAGRPPVSPDDRQAALNRLITDIDFKILVLLWLILTLPN